MHMLDRFSKSVQTLEKKRKGKKRKEKKRKEKKRALNGSIP